MSSDATFCFYANKKKVLLSVHIYELFTIIYKLFSFVSSIPSVCGRGVEAIVVTIDVLFCNAIQMRSWLKMNYWLPALKE